jgi:hypothetical protein
MHLARVAAERETEGLALPLERVEWGAESPAEAAAQSPTSILTRPFVGKHAGFLALAWAVVLLLGAVDVSWAILAGLTFVGWSKVVVDRLVDLIVSIPYRLYVGSFSAL